MPVAQVIRLDERQVIARPRREPQHHVACVILQLHAPRKGRAKATPPAVPMTMPDEDRAAGRGRDPG